MWEALIGLLDVGQVAVGPRKGLKVGQAGYCSDMAGIPRTILHLDLDAFYASVEQLDEPALRGRPVIVGGTSGRGVVCAASYEARRFGSDRPCQPAERGGSAPRACSCFRGCERYAEISDRVFGIYRRFTPLVEPLSLDEAFLDVSRSKALHGSGSRDRPGHQGGCPRGVRPQGVGRRGRSEAGGEESPAT